MFRGGAWELSTSATSQQAVDGQAAHGRGHAPPATNYSTNHRRGAAVAVVLAFGSPLLECVERAWTRRGLDTAQQSAAPTRPRACPVRTLHSAPCDALAAQLGPCCRSRTAHTAAPGFAVVSLSEVTLPCAGSAHARAGLPIDLRIEQIPRESPSSPRAPIAHRPCALPCAKNLLCCWPIQTLACFVQAACAALPCPPRPMASLSRRSIAQDRLNHSHAISA